MKVCKVQAHHLRQLKLTVDKIKVNGNSFSILNKFFLIFNVRCQPVVAINGISQNKCYTIVHQNSGNSSTVLLNITVKKVDCKDCKCGKDGCSIEWWLQ